ncbi:MAG: protein-disulfide reductase DsbD family protein, partial [Victivallaceae bacterium]
MNAVKFFSIIALFGLGLFSGMAQAEEPLALVDDATDSPAAMSPAPAAEAVPFIWQSRVEAHTVTIHLTAAPNCYIYSDAKVEVLNADGDKLELISAPAIEKYVNPELGELSVVTRKGDKNWVFKRRGEGNNFKVELDYMGCRSGVGGEAAVCFPPRQLAVQFNGDVAD